MDETRARVKAKPEEADSARVRRVNGPPDRRLFRLTLERDWVMVRHGIIERSGPVTVLCRSFDRIYCNERD
jgi:hypothetical protein